MQIVSGAGGSVERQVLILPEVEMTTGGLTLALTDVPVDEGADFSESYERLGNDFLAGHDHVLDFEAMQFRVLSD